MRKMLVVLASLGVAGCAPDLTADVEALNRRIDAQAAEIDRLNEFVNSQAAILTTYEETITSFLDYVINLSTMGMLREAATQIENASTCVNSFAEFGEAAQRAGITGAE